MSLNDRDPMFLPRGPSRFTAAAFGPQTRTEADEYPPAPAQPAQGPGAGAQPSSRPPPQFTRPPFQAPASVMLPHQPGVDAPPRQFLPDVPPGVGFPEIPFVQPFADPQVLLQLMQQGVQQQLAAQAFQQQLASWPGAYQQAAPPGADMLPEQPVLYAPPTAAPPLQAAPTHVPHAIIDPRTNQPIRPFIVPASAAPPAVSAAVASAGAAGALPSASPAVAAMLLAGISPANDAMGMKESMMKHLATKRAKAAPAAGLALPDTVRTSQPVRLSRRASEFAVPERSATQADERLRAQQVSLARTATAGNMSPEAAMAAVRRRVSARPV